MEIEFLIGNEIVYSRRISEKIPIIKNNIEPHIEIPSSSFNNSFIKNQNKKNSIFDYIGKKFKRINYYEGDDEEGLNNNSMIDDEFKASDSSLDEEDRNNEFTNSLSVSSENNSNINERKNLRKYGGLNDMNNFQEISLTRSHKRHKRELTAEEMARKVEQNRLRKIQAKKLLEEQKRETIERILNEDDRKLKEKQKKINDELIASKKKKEEEKMREKITKIIINYQKDGKIFIRFPKGLLLPQVLTQKKKEIKLQKLCEICEKNIGIYTEPKNKIKYCSVNCYKKIKLK